MLREILSERQERLLGDERALLDRLAAALDRLGADARRHRVTVARRSLDPLFLLAVAGGGETAPDRLLAALLGAAGDPEAGSSGDRLRWFDRPGRSAAGDPDVPFPVPESAAQVETDLPALEHLAVAAAPPGHAGGWGSRADLALYVTSAHRALPPPEHPLLVAAADGARSLLIVVEGVEMLRLSEDVDRMEEAAVVTAERLLGFQPLAQGVSTAGPATPAGEPPSRESLVPALASRIVGELRRPEVVRPKLLEPLESALRELEAARGEVAQELEDLAPDLETLERVESEVERFDRQAEEALREASEAVAEAVEAYGRRAARFVRRASRPIPLSLSERRLTARFDERAVADLPERFREGVRRLSRKLDAAADTARSEVVECLSAPSTGHSRGLPPSGGGDADEGTTPEGGGGADRPAADTDPAGSTDEAAAGAEGTWTPPDGRSVAADLRRTATLSWVLVGAGLLCIVLPVAAEALGFAGPGAIPPYLGAAIGGAAILAAVGASELRRRRLARRLAREVPEVRRSAVAALASDAERAAGANRQRLAAPAKPYVATVTAERDRLTGVRDSLEHLAGQLHALRSRIERL